MRAIKTLADAQIVIREILDWKTKLSTQNQDIHQLRITNAAPGVDKNDYVTVSQLPIPPVPGPQRDHHYTIVLSKDGIILDGDTTPPFMVHLDRVGIPTQVWVAVNGAPTADASFNARRNGINLLTAPLVLPSGTFKATASNLTLPVSQFAEGDLITGLVITGSSASQVSIGIVVKRSFQGG